MRQLDHPNIVKLIDFSESRQYYYIILELAPGGELPLPASQPACILFSLSLTLLSLSLYTLPPSVSQPLPAFYIATTGDDRANEHDHHHLP
jgi:serine/threonine protein kinase